MEGRASLAVVSSVNDDRCHMATILGGEGVVRSGCQTAIIIYTGIILFPILSYRYIMASSGSLEGLNAWAGGMPSTAFMHGEA